MGYSEVRSDDEERGSGFLQSSTGASQHGINIESNQKHIFGLQGTWSGRTWFPLYVQGKCRLTIRK